MLAAVAASALAHAPIAAAQTGTALEDVAEGAYYAEPVAALAADGVLAFVPGRAFADAVQVAFDALVDSPGHYANMTDPAFNHIGVGIAFEGSSFWFTQNFARYP